MNREQWIQKRSQYDALQGAMECYFTCAREARLSAWPGSAGPEGAEGPMAKVDDRAKALGPGSKPSGLVRDR